MTGEPAFRARGHYLSMSWVEQLVRSWQRIARVFREGAAPVWGGGTAAICTSTNNGYPLSAFPAITTDLVSLGNNGQPAGTSNSFVVANLASGTAFSNLYSRSTDPITDIGNNFNITEKEKGFYASLPQVGLAIGLCLSSGVVALLASLPDADFLAWGWRVAFIASILLVLVGLYIRLKIIETPEFQAVKEQNAVAKMPFVEMIKGYPVNILLGMGARYIDGVFFNVFAVFSIAYLTQMAPVKVSRPTALWAVAAAALVMVVAIPIFGRLSDRLGRPKTYAIGSALLAIVAYPAFWLMATGNPLLIFASMIVAFGVIYAICYGPEAALFADLFDPRVRYSGISFVYQFSGIFASGITPIIATYLLEANGKQPWYLVGYVVFAALVSMVSALAIGARNGRAG